MYKLVVYGFSWKYTFYVMTPNYGCNDMAEGDREACIISFLFFFIIFIIIF